MRRPIIAGNWKMNMTPSQTEGLIKELIPLVADAACDVVVCPPACCLPTARAALRGSNIALGAQNVHWEKSGAFTGEISAAMLAELGVTYVIVGHSERRQYFGETDETVNKRALAALAAGLVPIVCVGESLEVRESGGTEALVQAQTEKALSGMTPEQIAGLVIAYEPVWAIGTGRTATREQANETIGFLRRVVAQLAGAETAAAVRIQYGGSMNAANASSLMEMPEIDGGLIGGASLKPQDFAAIVHH